MNAFAINDYHLNFISVATEFEDIEIQPPFQEEIITTFTQKVNELLNPVPGGIGRNWWTANSGD